MINIGIGIPFIRRKSGAAIDAQAQAHFDRVIADGGQVPSGLNGVNNFFTTVKSIYGTSDITTAISVGLDAQVLGYKIGAGAGTTLGQAAQKLYSCSGASGDVVQTTAASQPLLLVHEGANYWFSPKNVTDNVSTPNAAANQIIGDIEIVANIDLIEANNNAIIAKRSGGNNISFSVVVDFLGRLAFVFTQNGSTTITAISSASITTANKWIKVTRQSSSGDVKFFTSTDGVTYTQLGTTQSTTAGNMFNSTASLIVGNNSVGGADGYGGKIYRLTISNSIGGAPVVDFNPNQYNAATSQTQWTSSTGEVWTINTGTAATGYKGVLVNRTIVQGDGVDDTLVSSTLPSKQFFSQHVALNPLNIPSSGGEYYVDGGGANGLIFGNADGLIVFNGAELSFTGDSEYRLQYAHADFNNTNSNLYLNNSNNVNGATGTRTTTSIALFSNGSGGAFGNALISTIISAITIDTSTQRTNVYNYARSINNNAF